MIKSTNISVYDFIINVYEQHQGGTSLRTYGDRPNAVAVTVTIMLKIFT